MNTAIQHQLRDARLACHLTQAKAAAAIGITSVQWSRIETGKSFATPSTARKIADLVGISVDLLLNWGTDIRNTEKECSQCTQQ